MKKLLLGSIALAVLVAAGPAMAADIPVKAPVKATPIISIYNWTGFYVGGNAGWGLAHTFGTNDNLVPNPNEHGPTTGGHNWNGFVGGGQIGYNWMASRNVVLGIEADLSFANLKTSIAGDTIDGIAYRNSKVDEFGTVRGRVGYAFNNWLIYGTGGAAFTHGITTNTQGPCSTLHGGTVNCTGPFQQVPLGYTDSDTLNLTGWTVGGGVEVGITQNWTTKLEYLHMDFGSFSFTDPLFNRITRANLMVDVVRLGLNYKFNWGGPVVAKY